MKTDRLTIDGWTVYVQERSRGAVATIRHQPWSVSTAGPPEAVIQANSCGVVLQKVERWISDRSQPAAGCRTTTDTAPPMEAWDVELEGDWEAHSPAEVDRLRQVQLMEARSLLGAFGINDRQALKTHFRQLAMTNHPDHGGDRQAWDRLHGAYKFLDHYLNPRIANSYDSQIKSD